MNISFDKNTTELEKKLKIRENTCIHCQTLELAKQVLNIFHKLNLTWCNKIYYTKCTNWDNYKENTVYYPFKGAFSSLEFAQEEGYKIINAKKFIASHTEEFNLENYEPKGDLIGFPKEIIARMLDCQEEQGNPRDVNIFESRKSIDLEPGGFDWNKTKEAELFWFKVITEKNFNLFFEKYPKKEDNSQEFKVGDEVVDIIKGKIGKVISINTLNKDDAIFVDFNEDETTGYTLDGKYYSLDKYPRLLHYRDDYDYSVIDFNNLPRRQEYKKWRAEKGGIYYFINRNEHDFNLDKIYKTTDYYSSFSNEQYKIGNYFKTREQAQEIVDQTNTYFQKIVKI